MTSLSPRLIQCWAFLSLSCLTLCLAGQQADEAAIQSYSRRAEEALARIVQTHCHVRAREARRDW